MGNQTPLQEVKSQVNLDNLDLFLKLLDEDILQQYQVLGDIQIIKNLTTNDDPTQESPSSSRQPTLNGKIYKTQTSLRGGLNKMALILRPKSNLGYKWMA